MMRLKRLSEIDPFASNIKERVQFPISPTVKEELSSSPLEPENSNSSILDMLKAQRATPRLRNYEKYLESEPNRKDHQAGKLSKILAAVAGTIEGATDSPSKGLNTYKAITDMPYITARQDWESKGSRLKELTELEHRGLSDEEKRLVQLENFRLKGLEEARTWYKDQKAMQLSDARINDITNRIKTQGLSVEKNEITGEMEVVDKIKGTRTSLGKFAESIPEKTKRENATWFGRETIRQGNRLQVQDRAFGQQLNMESIRSLNEGELARYRSLLGRDDDEIKRKLEGMTTAAQKTALELAFQQATLDNPELQEDDPGQFMVEVRKRLKNIRSRTSKDIETVIEDDPLGLFR